MGRGEPLRPVISPTELWEYRKAVHVAGLLLRLPSGISMRMDEHNLREFAGQLGFPAYSYVFPRHLDRLLGDTDYDPTHQLGE